MSSDPKPAIRIELAASSAAGGNCHAWIDLVHVWGLVARSTPPELFVNLVAPALRGSGPEGPGRSDPRNHEATAADGDEGSFPSELPASVRNLLAQLQAVHTSLFRENAARPDDAGRVEVTCAIAEEDRLYAIKGPGSWICLVRDGRAYLTESARNSTEAPAPAPAVVLGETESLRLELTSWPVRPNDTVILLAGGDQRTPSLELVERIFADAADLEGACEQLAASASAPEASAVALRFAPVGSAVNVRQDFLSDLTSPEEPAPAAMASATGAETPAPLVSAAEIDPLLDAMMPTPASEAAASAARAAPVARETAPPIEAEMPPAPRRADTFLAEDPKRRSERPEPAHPAGNPAAPATVNVPVAPDPASAARADSPAHAESSPREAETGRDMPGAEEPINRRPGRFLQGKRTLVRFVACGVACAVLLAIAAIPQGGRAPLAVRAFGMLTGKGSGGGTTGSLEVASIPAARQVLIDGETVAQNTPALLQAVPCGERTIALDFGPCGVWETRVRVRWGKTTTLAPTVTGSISVKGSAAGLVWMGDREKVALPAVLDSVPIGWVKLFYEDARTPMWDRRVLVKPGQRTEVVIPNAPAPGQGLVEVESLVDGGTKGLVASSEDTVWVDGEPAGTTPFRAGLMPGLHSVRVTGAKGSSCTEMVELMDGSSRVLPLSLSSPGPRTLRHLAPGRVWLRGPVLLSCEIDPESGPLVRPTLHMPGLPPGSREIPLAPVEGQEGVYLAMVGPELLRGSESQAYYFTASSPGGESLTSELYHLVPQSRRAASPRPDAGDSGASTSSW